MIVQLQAKRRVTYRTLIYVFGLDASLLEDIKEELLLTRVAHDEDSKVLVWTGQAELAGQPALTIPYQHDIPSSNVVTTPSVLTQPSQVTDPHAPISQAAQATQTNGPQSLPQHSPTHVLSDEPSTVPQPVLSSLAAERRQLTVMFCDLVGSTDLSGKLDPEDLREVVRAYQETAAEVIEHYGGHIAQYLGDDLLIYFGWPLAHEDDAQRAVYTGLGIPEAMVTLNTRLAADYDVQLAVRIGIHTGPVVVGEMGGGDRHENLALGETPNIAARLEGLAQANTAVISPVTAQLVQRTFVVKELGLHTLKGVAEPMLLYTAVSPREVASDYETMLSGGFEALVGRDEEIGLLLRRWEQSKEGAGQVVLITGEAGIGKSSLVNGIRRYANQQDLPCITMRCSQYHQNSVLYPTGLTLDLHICRKNTRQAMKYRGFTAIERKSCPIIDHVQRLLGFERDDAMADKLTKLEKGLTPYDLPLE